MKKLPQLRFARNSDRLDTYDFVSGPSSTNLRYVVLSKPKKNFLKKNAAIYVLESWDRERKILFTGLIPIAKNLFKGNHWSKTKGTIKELNVWICPDMKEISITIISNKKKRVHR